MSAETRKERYVTLNVSLSHIQKRILSHIALKHGYTVSHMIRVMINHYLATSGSPFVKHTEVFQSDGKIRGGGGPWSPSPPPSQVGEKR